MLNLDFTGKKVLVLGLGHFGGGVGVSRFLAGRGAKVTVTDLAGEDQLSDSLSQLTDLPITFYLGGHRCEDIEQADLVVVNPAIPPDSEWIQAALKLNVPLTSEMNLFFQFCRSQIIGVTGSNGKSTTASMIAHVIREASDKSRGIWLGGNIGRENLLERVEDIQPNDLVVLELSSFQLYDLAAIQRSPHIAVVTNISPNHLDWHGTMEAYVNAKKQILLHQTATDYAVLNGKDPELQKWKGIAIGEVHFSGGDQANVKLSVPGQHNQANAAAAMKVAEVLGLDERLVRASLKNYLALEHRLECVGEIDGVRYFNDSIATTPESAMAAIDAFNEPKILILGGYDKNVCFESLVKKIIGDKSVCSVVCVGQVAGKLMGHFKGVKNDVIHCERTASLEDAMSVVQRHAKPGMVVLFSPACASYDMYLNFRDRGDQFRRRVLEMKKCSFSRCSTP